VSRGLSEFFRMDSGLGLADPDNIRHRTDIKVRLLFRILRSKQFFTAIAAIAAIRNKSNRQLAR